MDNMGMLEKMQGLISIDWSSLGFIFWRVSSHVFKFLIAREEERTKRMASESNEKIRILEINTNKEIKLIKLANKHEEFKILNGNSCGRRRKPPERIEIPTCVQKPKSITSQTTHPPSS